MTKPRTKKHNEFTDAYHTMDTQFRDAAETGGHAARGAKANYDEITRSLGEDYTAAKIQQNEDWAAFNRLHGPKRKK